MLLPELCAFKANCPIDIGSISLLRNSTDIEPELPRIYGMTPWTKIIATFSVWRGAIDIVKAAGPTLPDFETTERLDVPSNDAKSPILSTENTDQTRYSP